MHTDDMLPSDFEAHIKKLKCKRDDIAGMVTINADIKVQMADFTDDLNRHNKIMDDIGEKRWALEQKFDDQILETDSDLKNSIESLYEEYRDRFGHTLD